MSVFYLTLFSTYLISLTDRIVNEQYQKRNFYLFLFITMTILSLVAGLRNTIGDTEMYVHSFNLLDESSLEVVTGSSAPLFELISVILKNISTEPQILLLFTGVITTVINILVLRKYGALFELQVWMYITSGYYLVTMNGIRQAFAAAFLFLATKYIISGEFKKYLVCVLLCATIHASAFILIPVYFIVRLPAWSKKTFIFIGIATFAFLLWSELMPFFLKAIQGTQYEHYNQFLMQDGLGSNPIRVIFFMIPVILAYICRGILKERMPNSDIIINMSIINSVIMFFSLYNWIFARFTIYFQLYLFILFPYIIAVAFTKKMKPLVYIAFIVVYFLYFYYEHVLALNIIYSSDYIKF